MINYKVSIGVPVYNAAKYIERCTKSILSQSFENLEVVFVDDCSTDNSVSIIEQTLVSYPQRKNQVRIIHHDENQGVSVARNTLLSAFTGEFFSFVDADDYLMPNAIRLLVDKQIQDNSDIVTGNILVDYGDRKQRIVTPLFNSADEMLYCIVNDTANHYNFARLYRHSLVKQNKISYTPEIKFGEDWLFLVMIMLHIKTVAGISDEIYTYDYTNEQSAMHKITKKDNYCNFVLADLKVFQKMKNLVKCKDLVYANSVERLMSKRIEDGLLEAYRNHNREAFSMIKSYIKEIDKSNVDVKSLYRRASIGSFLYPESYDLYFWLRRQWLKLKNN